MPGRVSAHSFFANVNVDVVTLLRVRGCGSGPPSCPVSRWTRATDLYQEQPNCSEFAIISPCVSASGPGRISAHSFFANVNVLVVTLQVMGSGLEVRGKGFGVRGLGSGPPPPCPRLLRIGQISPHSFCSKLFCSRLFCSKRLCSKLFCSKCSARNCSARNCSARNCSARNWCARNFSAQDWSARNGCARKSRDSPSDLTGVTSVHSCAPVLRFPVGS